MPAGYAATIPRASTRRQLTALTGLHPRTVLRHLVALHAAELAVTGGGARAWARSLAAGSTSGLQATLNAVAVLGSTRPAARRGTRCRAGARRTGPMSCLAVCWAVRRGSGVVRWGSQPLSGCIPMRYRIGMSIQIAVRLPDELVHAVDELVSRGEASSRADLVARALRRELRRQRAIADLDRLGGEDDADLASFTAHAVRTPLPD